MYKQEQVLSSFFVVLLKASPISFKNIRSKKQKTTHMTPFHMEIMQKMQLMTMTTMNLLRFTRHQRTLSLHCQQHMAYTNYNNKKDPPTNSGNDRRNYRLQTNEARSSNTEVRLVCFNSLRPNYGVSLCNIAKDRERINNNVAVLKKAQNIFARKMLRLTLPVKVSSTMISKKY